MKSADNYFDKHRPDQGLTRLHSVISSVGSGPDLHAA